MNLTDPILILGAGESGVGSALLAKSVGARAFVSDAGEGRGPGSAEMKAHGIGHELGGHRPEAWMDTEVVVKSPGIPDDAPIVDTCRAQGREVISDIEYASRVFTAQGHTTPVVAVTGANGKTTTTSMIDHVLRHEGWDVDCVGNIGTSWSRRLAERHEAGDAAAQATVIEVSSFQLDGTSTFSPDVAVLLNITPDHLDRYGNDMSSYAASKWRITQAQKRATTSSTTRTATGPVACSATAAPPPNSTPCLPSARSTRSPAKAGVAVWTLKTLENSNSNISIHSP